ncbi:hypothetical protein GE061_016632 [Apolygus lucorum]|uniref:DUF4773 domain-containing protein n=1 Tax=Apolygus lucorum TaxID=248454 RepID=A0A6A4JPF4_APOLU|nr:hypothetical protein GE061_016632 [Apolygus lucorum]
MLSEQQQFSVTSSSLERMAPLRSFFERSSRSLKMQSTKLFWVLLLGVVATAASLDLPVEGLLGAVGLREAQDAVLLEAQDPDHLEEVGTREAPLDPEAEAARNNISFETGDSSEDSNERAFWTTSKGESRCTCTNVACECCVSPKLPIAGKIRTCLKITVLANEKAVHLQLSGKGRNLIGHKFVIGGRERICASVPASLGSLKGCIDTETSSLPNNGGVQTCPKLELRTVGKTVAALNFACIQYANRRVSFNNNGRVSANQKVGFKFF